MVQVKICGINTPAAADMVASVGADFAGLVFFPRSPRNVGPELATALAARLRHRCQLVAVLVDPSNAELERAIVAARPDFLQLHGSESPERVAAVRHRFGVPVIKALPVADATDITVATLYEQVADRLLFDAKPPSNAARPGGHGAAFDWQLLRGRRFSRPWLLGGGLNPSNVPLAIRTCGAQGVDCSSGVESAPGVKDAGLIREFVAAAGASHVTESMT